MRFSLLLLLSLVLCAASLAQDIRYVSGEQPVPLRGGAGDDYPVVYRGLAAGTRLTVAGTSEDGQWAEITTAEGITGWIPSQKLVLEEPVPTASTTTTPPPVDAPNSVAGAQATTAAELESNPLSCLPRLTTVRHSSIPSRRNCTA